MSEPLLYRRPRPGACRAWVAGDAARGPHAPGADDGDSPARRGRVGCAAAGPAARGGLRQSSKPWKVGILTVSDTRSQGLRADTATPLIRKLLEGAGFMVSETVLVSDDQRRIQGRLIDMADRLRLALVVTTGGTGFGPRDVTPEATRGVIDREVPGLPEAMRVATAKRNPLAWLSRAAAGLRGRTLIVNLPGNPEGAKECLEVLLPLLPHALEMLQGGGHEARHAGSGAH